MVINLDTQNQVSEPDEGNNRVDLILPVSLSTTLTPSTTTILTSASEALTWIFPAGAVDRPTQISFTPLWPGGWQTAPLIATQTAFLLTATVDGQPVLPTFSVPVSMSWDYSDKYTSGVDENGLRLFRGDGEIWRDAACMPYQRDPAENRLMFAICHTGRFLFGARNDLFLPLVAHESTSLTRDDQPLTPPASVWAPSPLRLPTPEDR
jgi:hypothetical protein